MIYLKSHNGKPEDGSISPKGIDGGIRTGAGRVRSVLEGNGNMMVILTILSVILSIAVGSKWFSPLLHVAPVYPFFRTAMKRHKHKWSLVLTARWAAALFATTIIIGVFVPERVGDSIPFAHSTTTTIANWLRTPEAPPPADYGYLLWGIGAFLLASLISGGLLGFALTSIAIGNVAFGTLFLFRFGINVIQIALVAVPLWQWSIFGAAIFMLVPGSLPFYERFVKIERVAEGRGILTKFMYLGGAFLTASLLLRLTTAGIWGNILREWTIL